MANARPSGREPFLRIRSEALRRRCRDELKSYIAVGQEPTGKRHPATLVIERLQMTPGPEIAGSALYRYVEGDRIADPAVAYKLGECLGTEDEITSPRGLGHPECCGPQMLATLGHDKPFIALCAEAILQNPNCEEELAEYLKDLLWNDGPIDRDLRRLLWKTWNGISDKRYSSGRRFRRAWREASSDSMLVDLGPKATVLAVLDDMGYVQHFSAPRDYSDSIGESEHEE
jgi:hypothetical protein